MTTMLRVLIADDETDARDKLKRLLSRNVDAVVVGEAATGREAIERTRVLRPDIVLLDIRMPEMDGLRAAGAFGAEPARSPKVVFVTAHDEYAVSAFAVRAFDYLLKPFDAKRLDAALDRVRTQIDLEHHTPSSYLERVCVHSAGRVVVVKMDDVEWIEACGNYARLHTASGRPMLREAIRRLVEQLDPTRFARVHRSAIVRLDCVREMRPCASGDYVVELASGTRLRLSRSYRPELDRRLNRRG